MRILILSACLVLAASAVSAKTVSEDDRNHCFAVGKAMDYKTQALVDSMLDDKTGKYSTDDIQEQKDLLAHIENDFLPLFEAPDQVEDLTLEGKLFDLDADDLKQELNWCYALTQP